MINNAQLQISKTFIQRLLLLLIGFFCYLYTVYGSDFAEWEIGQRYFGFPIFVGEGLLLISMVLLLIYFCKSPTFLSRPVLLALIGYGLWIFINALTGYLSGGALALRNSALFYYSFFALAGYTMFERGLCNSWWRWVVVGLLMLSLFFASISDYFVAAYWFLLLGFFLHVRPNWLKVIGILVLIGYAVSSKFFFIGSRSHMIGIALMMVFLTGYYTFGFTKISWKTKALTMIGLVGLVFGGLFIFGDQNALRSMISLKSIREQYAQWDQEVERGRKYYVPSSLSSQVYYQNQDNQMAHNLLSYTRTAGQSLSGPTSSFNAVQLNAINDSAESFMIKAMHIKEAAIHQRAEEIYQRTRSILERQNAMMIEKAKTDLANDIQIFIDESEGDVEADLEEALKNFSLALRHNTERSIEELKRTVDKTSESRIENLREAIRQTQIDIVNNVVEQKTDRSLEIAYNNIFFRFFIWRDMWRELKQGPAWLGMGFGHPQRSPSIEILEWASVEWRRDGWITPHNSFLHIVYRGGIFGVLLVLLFIGTLIYLVRGFVKHRSVWGGLLVACLMYWIGISNFLVFLELPYNAIPFWTFFGMIIGYYHSLEKGKLSSG